MNNKPHIIAITGGSGSGKTFLCNRIIEKFGKEKILKIEVDSYYKDLIHLRMEEREKNNFDHPDAFDFDLLNKHLNILNCEDTIKIPIYNYKTHTRKKNTSLINKTPILILEGIFSIYNEKLRNLIDFKVYLDTPDIIRKERRIIRDKNYRGRTHKSILKQYENTDYPMYKQYIEPMKKYSDLIIKDNSENSNEINILTNYINSILNNLI